MGALSFTSREFNQRVSEAKKAAKGSDLVFITDRGQPAHVLMSMERFTAMMGKKKSLVEMLSMPEAAEIEIEIQRSTDLPREVDFS